MKTNQNSPEAVALDDIYAEAEQWQVNTGNETIHAKRLPGKWRTIK